MSQENTIKQQKWKKILPKPNDLANEKEANVIITGTNSGVSKIAISSLSQKTRQVINSGNRMESLERRRCIWLERRVVQLQREILNLTTREIPRIITRMEYLVDRETTHPLCDKCRQSKDSTFDKGSLEEKTYWRPKQDCEQCKVAYDWLKKIDHDERLWNNENV